MKPHVNRLVAPLARRVRSFVWPTLARKYRKDPAKTSDFTLKLLGIADASYRPAFEVLANAVDKTANFEGDIIECGVFRGSTLLGMAHRLACRGIRNVKLIGCDSFQGFPAPSPEDALENGSFHERALQGSFSDTDYDALCSRLAALGFASQIRILKGFFEETLPKLHNTSFSIVHLDCDLYQSYQTCLNFLYPRLLPGGYMVFDEYDHSAPVYPGAQRAIDEFLAGKPEKLQRFGQGENQRCYLIKL